VRDVELFQDRAVGVRDPDPVCVATDINADAKLRLHACLLAARVRSSRRSRLLLRATGHNVKTGGVAQRLPSCPAGLDSPPSPFGLPWMAQMTGAAFQSRAVPPKRPRTPSCLRRKQPDTNPVEVSLPCRGCSRLRTKDNGRPRHPRREWTRSSQGTPQLLGRAKQPLTKRYSI